MVAPLPLLRGEEKEEQERVVQRVLAPVLLPLLWMLLSVALSRCGGRPMPQARRPSFAPCQTATAWVAGASAAPTSCRAVACPTWRRRPP
jgi:hypothetical protein